MSSNQGHTASLRLTGDVAFTAEFPAGHEVVFDGLESAGATPMDVLLGCLAACTGIDVISILRKMREPVEEYRVLVEGERAEEHPRVYTRITITHIVAGGVDEERLAHAIELSEERYCSISAMLAKTAKIETAHRIEPSSHGIETSSHRIEPSSHRIDKS
jgi:putative redox protein